MKTRIMDDGHGGWTAVDNPRYRPRGTAEIPRIMATAA